VRAEKYGPAHLSETVQAARVARRQSSLPPIAVVSRSCRLDWDTPFFTSAVARPYVVTVSSSAPADRARAAENADVIIAGDRDVDLVGALGELGARGARHVLAEGGPTLNGALARARLLDELCVTLSPRLASGDAKRIIAGSALDELERLRLRSICEEDDYLFLRYRPVTR
jgi:riboflavin biosynthesis pyrimidine reductase